LGCRRPGHARDQPRAGGWAAGRRHRPSTRHT